MADASTSFALAETIILLGAAVIAVPIFRRLGLGSVLGYLAAGLIIGPFGFKLVNDPASLLHVAELGVVMFLFIIGLEMRPRKLWTLRHQIFGLGAAQLVTCGALLTGIGILAGIPAAPAAVGAMGFVLSSTAVIMHMLSEKGEAGTEEGQKAISILLFEDLAIVPLLALVALWAAVNGGASAEDQTPVWQSAAVAVGAVLALIAAGRWLLNPLFGVIARAGAREVLTAAALLIVLGAAVLLDAAGLSMAMGAFMAGVLLSESSYRHELEADVEPFRGILLGLFFLSVGMSLNIPAVLREWQLIVGGVAAFMIVKAAGIYVIARLFGTAHHGASNRAVLFAQGGEFAFVLYGAALSVGLFDPRLSAIMTAIVILSMALTPLALILHERFRRPAPVSMDGIDHPEDLSGRILCIGFGHFAQVASQALLANRLELSLIENDVEMIQVASKFGFKVYYGDGTRLDVLHASGAGRAEAILICVDKPEVADRIVELCQHEFPLAKLYVRAFDRDHALRLIKAGVDYQIRELFESALVFSKAVLTDLGVDEDDAQQYIDEVRDRDEQRVEAELVGGVGAGRYLMRNNVPTPEPEPFFPAPRKDATPG